MTNLLDQLSEGQLRRRTSVKWNEFGPDVLPLWVAEMDVPLAEPVVRAVSEAVTLGDTGYPSGTGYAEALRDFAAERWGWRPATERTALVPDVMLGIVEVLKLITAVGDAVVVNSPVYPPFYAFVEHLGRRVVEAPLGTDHRIDPDRLREVFTAATAGGRRAAFLLCSPHNPTGTVHTRAELEAVAQLAGRYGVRVVVDEIHAPLVLPPATFVPYLSMPSAADAFAVTSASKAWNLAGLKAGLAVAGQAAAADLARMPEVVGHGASHLGVIAHTAALRHGGEWLDALLGALIEQRSLLGRLLAENLPEIGFEPPAGTYLAWLDCRRLGWGDDPAAVLLQRARVALMSGPTFGTGGAGHVRLNFATSRHLLTEAVRRMGDAR